MDQGLAALMGALIGGLITLATTWGVEFRRERRDARNSAVAAAAEIDAILMMLRAREWRAAFEIAHREAGRGSIVQLSIHVQNNEPLPLCRAAMKHAGSIDQDLAVLLARLVTIADGLTADLRRLSEYPPNDPKGLLFSDEPAGAQKIYLGLIQMLDAGFQVGLLAIERVKLIYPKPADPTRIRLFRALARGRSLATSLRVRLARRPRVIPDETHGNPS